MSIASNGAITFGNSPTRVTAVGTVPQDGKFHHVALIADVANPYRSLLLVVDGTVIDSFKMTAAEMFAHSFATSSGSWYYTRVDEMRLSKDAQYTLSYERPVSFFSRKPSSVLK